MSDASIDTPIVIGACFIQHDAKSVIYVMSLQEARGNGTPPPSAISVQQNEQKARRTTTERGRGREKEGRRDKVHKEAIWNIATRHCAPPPSVRVRWCERCMSRPRPAGVLKDEPKACHVMSATQTPPPYIQRPSPLLGPGEKKSRKEREEDTPLIASFDGRKSGWRNRDLAFLPSIHPSRWSDPEPITRSTLPEPGPCAFT